MRRHSKGAHALLAGMAAAAAAASSPAAADPLAVSNMGGGFIELLMTGRTPGRPVQRPAPAPLEPHAAPSMYYGAQTAPYAPGLSPSYNPYEPGPAPAVPHGRQPRASHAALNPDFRQVERSLDPAYLPQVVDYEGPHRPGTIVIDTPRRFLFLVEGNGKARRYGIGVGRPGFEWAGVKSITRKAEWPDWRPPPEMLKRRPDLPRYMAGGPENPMGARGLYLGSSLYRIHGTNEPHTIGQAVSSGCIRMRNEDVTDLYERVRVGTKVIVI
jgi:lipoprotein-anchoring transpeptidase ErfK/SrfK